MVKGNEEVSNLNDCVAKSWEDMANIEMENYILKADAEWAIENNLHYHPSVVINKFRFKGDITGEKLAQAICGAYKERPDECELSWKINSFQHGLMESIDDDGWTDPEDKDESLNAALRYMNVTEHERVIQDMKRPKGRLIHIFLMIMAIIAVNGCVLLWWRRRTARENNDQINE